MNNPFRKIPVIGSLVRTFYYTFIVPFKSFSGSEDYWKQRYQEGGTSGPGSYNRLAQFKADVINDFLKDKDIKSIIEYGCGDGNQLSLSAYPHYIGFDVSPVAIEKCKRMFADDKSKVFKLQDEYAGESSDVTMSLDVIYHLLEDKVFFAYMKRLFDSSKKYVIIYASNIDKPAQFHVRHRKFSVWIERNCPNWKLIQHIPNKYPFSRTGDNETEYSFADFFIYQKNK